VAFDCAQAGHDVWVFDFPDFPANIAAISKQGGILAEGQLQGFAPVRHAGHVLAPVIEGADLVMVVGPAYSTESFARACRPHLEPGQTVVVCPSSCAGAIVFKNALGLGLADDRFLIADTATLPYAVRVTEPGQIHVFLKLQAGVYLAAIPGVRTGEVLAKIKDIYPCLRPARNVLQTSLQNGNPVIHPAVTLLNAALIERTGGDFCFYEEGVTPAVGRLMEAVDRERITLGAALGMEILPDPEIGVLQGYMREATYDRGYREAPGFQGIRAQSDLEYRYFHEDVGFGLVFLSSLAQRAGVATPVIDAIICLASVLMKRDYRRQSARSLESLGLGDVPLDDLLKRL
jgi:opine dehydrogenase